MSSRAARPSQRASSLAASVGPAGDAVAPSEPPASVLAVFQGIAAGDTVQEPVASGATAGADTMAGSNKVFTGVHPKVDNHRLECGSEGPAEQGVAEWGEQAMEGHVAPCDGT